MRADCYLVAAGHAASRQKAKTLIEGGSVLVDGKKITKPAAEIDEQTDHEVEVTATEKYVSRGGLKLEGALTAFGIDPTGMTALDVGASTGGFTDCLLQHGVAHVYAFDAGIGQLAPSLRADPHVTVREHINCRNLTPADVGESPHLIVMDVSFISSTYIIPAFPALLRENGIYIGLIKPQFELDRHAVGKNGIVKKPEDRLRAVERVCAAAMTVGLIPIDLAPSPIEGGDGNREFLLLCRKGAREEPVSAAKMRRTVYERSV